MVVFVERQPNLEANMRVPSRRLHQVVDESKRPPDCTLVMLKLKMQI